jgi:hypothetical protein
MPRITCRTPSTGKPLSINQGNVPTSYVTIAEAPDFSVPDPSQKYTDRDPTDSSRAVRPGEIFFLTPMSARNKSANDAWIEAQLVTEANVTVNFGRVIVPAGDTVFIPFQGRSLLKRNPAGANGDRIQIRAQTAEVFDVWAAAEEKLSSEHTGVEE